MAFIVTVKHRLFTLSLIIFFVSNGKLGNAVYELVPSNGAQSSTQSGSQGGGQTGQFGGAQSGGQNGQFGGTQSGGQNGQFGGTQSGGQNGQFGGAQSGGQTGQFGGQAGGSAEDPTAIVEKALHCFNDNYVYSSCQESYRLTESGELHVPPEATDEYCQGPCVSETHLVLNCIGGVMTHFEFYNKATLEDVSETIQSGCGHGNQRGNFNVAEHIQENDYNSGNKITTRLAAGFVLMILVQGLLFR